MWIVKNDAFLSVVKDRHNENQYAVRARVREDLVNAFPDFVDFIIESDDSDYRFRIFVTKDELKDMLSDSVDSIDYDNFKSSVLEKWRYNAYTAIWGIMYRVQEDRYGANPWWKTYRYR